METGFLTITRVLHQTATPPPWASNERLSPRPGVPSIQQTELRHRTFTGQLERGSCKTGHYRGGQRALTFDFSDARGKQAQYCEFIRNSRRRVGVTLVYIQYPGALGTWGLQGNLVSLVWAICTWLRGLAGSTTTTAMSPSRGPTRTARPKKHSSE